MGRQYDILFLQVNPALVGPAPQKTPMTFGDTTKVITGVQKAIQAFLCILFTKKGQAWNTAAGCDFLGVLEQGLIRTAVDAQNYFSRDVPGILAQVNTGVTEPDETLVSAVLEAATVERDRMMLRIRLQTAAGTSTTFTAPV